MQKYYNGQKITFVPAEPVIKDLWEAYEEFLKAGELGKGTQHYPEPENDQKLSQTL